MRDLHKGTLHFQLVYLPLAFLVGENFKPGGGIAQGALWRESAPLYTLFDPAQALVAEVCAAATGQVREPLNGTEANRTGEPLGRLVHVELLVK